MTRNEAAIVRKYRLTDLAALRHIRDNAEAVLKQANAKWSAAYAVNDTAELLKWAEVINANWDAQSEVNFVLSCRNAI
ncbi:hypothetical protein UFOVP168_44 [uncultured Caudovirales phage]|uniref:Uncharacterized protein n=1 Tax=uncultured Caudovirales phage TaxID=2100421 RepID=A0A6J7WG03_9CAUD|nr:hypothetical protein UFOVP168_44 [uncultured Caudovirales phage]